LYLLPCEPVDNNDAYLVGVLTLGVLTPQLQTVNPSLFRIAI